MLLQLVALLRRTRPCVLACLIWLAMSLPALAQQGQEVDRITQYGITWLFAKPHATGRFCNGDHWVRGPVTIIKISNTWHTHGFVPGPDKDGSMVDPDASGRQGYDGVLSSYKAELNAAQPKGKPLSVDNPLVLKPGSSLISAVSWLYASKDKAEPGCPRFNGGTHAPRPVLRYAAVLTCLAEGPPAGAFRPPYCGKNKTPRFTKDQLRRDRLPNLKPVKAVPSLTAIEASLERPWIDHVHEYLGAMLHPSANMPQYGKDMAIAMGNAALVLLLDFKQLPDSPSNETLLIRFVQLGIDLAGIADAGGSWPHNGGHHMGRKWPILFAGLMLDDAHMMQMSRWKTMFQEDAQTFYVSQKDVDITHGKSWRPDKRAKKLPYEAKHIGLPEWGIRHERQPQADNLAWGATYRSINGPAYVGFVLAARIMEQKEAWHHDALFDYVDRWVVNGPFASSPQHRHYGGRVYGGAFVQAMWQAYRDQCGPRWVPDNPKDCYSNGKVHAPAEHP